MGISVVQDVRESLTVLRKKGGALIAFIWGCTCFVVMLCLYLDYRDVLHQRKLDQDREVVVLQQKSSHLFKELETHMFFGQRRLEPILFSTEQDVSEKIRKVLSSMTHLDLNRYPLAFHRVAFYTFSSLPSPSPDSSKKGHPSPDAYPKLQKVITRLGEESPLQKDEDALSFPSTSENTGVFFDLKPPYLIARCFVDKPNDKPNIEGGPRHILEIRLNLSDIHGYLAPSPQLFLPTHLFDTNHQLIVTKEEGPTLWEYSTEHWRQYNSFFLLTFIAILGIGVMCIVIWFHTRQTFQDRLITLHIELSEALQTNEGLIQQVAVKQEKFQRLTTAQDIATKIQIGIHDRQQDNAQYIAQSLDILEQSLMSPTPIISDADMIEIVTRCQRRAEALSLGAWKRKDPEEFTISSLINRSLELCGDQICEKEIQIHLDISEEEQAFSGDPLLLQVLIANLIGSTLYGMPPKGYLGLRLLETGKSITLEMEDSSFLGGGRLQSVVKNFSSLFMVEENFRNVCRKNGIEYKRLSNRPGEANRSMIEFFRLRNESDKNESEKGSNVVQLFQK